MYSMTIKVFGLQERYRFDIFDMNYSNMNELK